MSGERPLRAESLLALPLFLLSCRPGAPPVRHEQPLAEYTDELVEVRDTIEVDAGEPAARPFLAAGFGVDEESDEGSFVRIEGASALVALELWEPRERRLRLSAWSTDRPGEVAVRVLLNGVAAGGFRAGREPATHEITLSRDLWRAGENRLRLESDPPGADLPLALAGLRFAGEEAAPDRGASARFSESGDLVVPAGRAAALYLDLPAGARLSWQGVVTDSPDLRLALRVRADAAEGVRAASVPEGPGPGGFDLTSSSPRLVALALRAVGAEVGEVRLIGPSLDLPGPPPTAATPAARFPRAPPVTARSRPDLVIYLVDTLRADHLGCYGYSRPTSPELDAFARESILYREGRTQSSWTRAAVATIFTGLEPITHLAQNTNERLANGLTTLAELLSGVGYQTAMITTNGNVARRFGFAQGFGRFEYLREDESAPELHVTADVVMARAARFLARRDPDRPFFLLLHVSDPHDPYAPRQPFRDRLARDVPLARGSAARLREVEERRLEVGPTELAEIVALYDGEIAQSDAAFGDLLALLGEAGVADDAAVLFLSDHGEEFLDHGGWTHGKTLYEEQLRIPFVLRLPRGEGAGARPDAPARLIDVLPTFAELAGLAPSPDLPGRSLLADVRGEPGGPLDLYAWLARDGYQARTLRSDGWKLIVRPGGPRGGSPYAELFSLADDPRELEDLAWSHDVRRSALEARLTAASERWRPDRSSETVQVGPEMRRRLRALGYLR